MGYNEKLIVLYILNTGRM